MLTNQGRARRTVANTRLPRYDNGHRSSHSRSRPLWPTRYYVIRRNLFSVDNKYTIYENNEEQYQLRGGILFAGIDNMMLEDRFGTPLFRIVKELGHFFHPTFELFSSDGHPLATIRKPFFGTDLDINTVYGAYRVQVISRVTGSYTLLNAQNQVIASGAQTMATVLRDQNQAFILALAIVINQFIKPHPPPSHSSVP